MAAKTEIITQEQLAVQQEFAQRVRAFWQDREAVPRVYIDTYGCQQNPKMPNLCSSTPALSGSMPSSVSSAMSVL